MEWEMSVHYNEMEKIEEIGSIMETKCRQLQKPIRWMIIWELDYGSRSTIRLRNAYEATEEKKTDDVIGDEQSETLSEWNGIRNAIE